MTASKNTTAPEWTDPDDAPDLSAPYWRAKLDATRARGRHFHRTQSFPTIRLDADVIEALKASGKGWQTRANALLRKGLAL